MKTCSVEQCMRPHHAKGYCKPHYKLAQRNGAPTVIGRWPEGRLEFLRSLLGTAAQDCIVWPYRRSAVSGYGFIEVSGITRSASRLMCEMAYGPPTTAHHQAAHSCNNGHLGCVNPNHLRWATPKENAKDRLDAGRYNSKISDAEAAEIRAMLGTVTGVELARQFQVTQSTISKIKKRSIHRGE